jgi:hypothetical protein
MRTNLSDAQYSTLIGIVARLPIEQARRLFLERVEAALPAKGKISEAQLTDVVNNAHASFKPGTWQGDEQGFIPAITETTSLKDAAAIYQRALKGSTWWWPPIPPRQPMTEEQRKDIAAKVAAMSQEECAEAYARTMFATEEEYQRNKAEVAERKAKELEDSTPWPVDPSPPPRVPVIRGTVEPEPARNEFPTMDDMRAMAKADQSADDDMSPMAEAAMLAKRSRKRGGVRRLSDRVKVFFK